MTTLYIKNLGSTNVTVEGDYGKNRIAISAAVGSYTTVAVSAITGDSTFCTQVSNLITASTVSVTIDSLSGTAVTAAGMLRYAAATTWDSNEDGVLDYQDVANIGTGLDVDDRVNMSFQRLKVTGLAIDTLNDEVSAALGGVATNLFVPTRLIVQVEDVGAGAAAAGDYEITVGITTGGTEILTATACTGCNTLNETFQIDLTGVLPEITADETIYVKCTSADSTAGAGHLADIYVVGEIVVAGA